MWSWVGGGLSTWDVEAVPDQYGGKKTTQAAVLSWTISDTNGGGTAFCTGDFISCIPGDGTSLSNITFSMDLAVTGATGTQPVTIRFSQYTNSFARTFDAYFNPVLGIDGSWTNVSFTLDELTVQDGIFDAQSALSIDVCSGPSGMPYVIGNYSVKMDNLELSMYAHHTWPHLVPVSDYVAIAGVVISLQVSAKDTNSPPNQLTFSLGPDAPPGATINPTNGLFTWPTTSDDAETYHTITVMVTEDGIPPRSDTNTFTIVLLDAPTIRDFALSDTNFVVSWSAVPGLVYYVQFASSLTGPWTNLPDYVLATNTIAYKEDNTTPTGVTNRFYRVITGSSMVVPAIDKFCLLLEKIYPGPGITVDRAPAASESTVTVNDPIPLVVSASDIDQLEQDCICQKQSCICLGWSKFGISSRLVDLADPITYRWVLQSGGGSLAAVDCPATLYTPPDLYIGETNIAIVQAIITDSRGNDVPATVTCRIEITRLDEYSYKRIITVQTQTTSGNPIVISPSQCDCGPLGDWQEAPDALTAQVQSPVVVGVGQRVLLQASGSDSDTLTLYCSGDCGHPETTSKLADELKYTWSAAQGSFPDYGGTPMSNGRQTSVIYQAPDTASNDIVTVVTQNSGIQAPGDVPITNTIQIKVCKVEVSNIKFNHDTGSSASDAINIRMNYDTNYDISNGEWIKGATNIPVCYTTNKAITIKARFTVQPAGVITSADIWAVSTDSGGSLSDVIKTNVTFSGGVSSPEYVTFQVSGRTPNCIQKTTNDVWQWKMENINGTGSTAWNMNTSGVHTVYTILNEPVAPWDNTAGSPKNAWTEVLDKSCTWAADAVDETSVVAKITPGAYSGFGKAYDGTQTHTISNFCSLTEMLSDTVVDCRDMSAVVELYTRIVGGSTVQVRRVDGPFYTEIILPIGNTAWSSGRWNFHQFGWYDGTVNDACVKLNESAPYCPVHDDLNGNYESDLFDSGIWTPLTPDAITDFQ